MHFDLIDLRLFVHVAEAQSFTGGGKRAFLSVSATSNRIKMLESQLDSRLFYRERQGVRLTPAGDTLLRHARTILRQIEHVKNEFSSFPDNSSGHLRIFANTTAVTEFMPEVLSKFLAERNGLTIDLEERMTRDILRGVQEGAADFGIVAGVINTPELEVKTFSSDYLVVVTPEHHPLTSMQTTKFDKTLEYPHIGLHEGSTLLKFLQDQVNNLGMTLPLRIKVFGFESACRMVEAGVGVCIIPQSSAIRYAKTMNIRIIKLKEEWARRDRSVVMREFDALPTSGQDLIMAITKNINVASVKDLSIKPSI